MRTLQPAALVLALGMALVGCDSPAPKYVASQTWSIDTKEVASDPPQFKREYRTELINGITLKVTLYTTSFSDRYDMSELDQPNGQWVLFDVKSPADKILDRELLPHVQAACEEILRIDAAYIASNPERFTDSKGTTWERVK